MTLRDSLAVLALMLATAAYPADSWTGPDKVQHAAAGAAIGALATLATRDERTGIAVGCVAGAAKEVWDSRHPPHQQSFKDFAVTCAAAVLASRGTGVVLTGRGLVVTKAF